MKVDPDEVDIGVYLVHPEALRVAERLAGLATDLLPDFIDGSIEVKITDPIGWVGDRCKVDVQYVPGDQRLDPHTVVSAGEGAGRWMAAAIQIALDLVTEYRELSSMRDAGPNGLSGRVILIWKIADLLRGPYQPNQYGDVILPFTILRRLDCIVEPTKDEVLAEYKKSPVDQGRPTRMCC
jgi:hypothetical protein